MERGRWNAAATSGSAPDAPDHEHAFDASPVSLRKDESTSSGRGSVTQGGSKRSKKLAELLALQYPSRCHALPAGDAAVEKVLYFVRHGEATHNVVRETHVGSDNPYLNPALTDAPLTAVGRAQAERLRPAADGLPLELVISSPLTRALETARLAFAAHLARGAPFVAVESCREQIGQNLCDKRQPASLTRPLFPEADMSAIAEADELFTPARETLGALRSAPTPSCTRYAAGPRSTSPWSRTRPSSSRCSTRRSTRRARARAPRVVRQRRDARRPRRVRLSMSARIRTYYAGHGVD